MNELYVNLLGRFGFKCIWEVPNTMTCLDIIQVNKDPNLYSKSGCFLNMINSKTSGHLFFRDHVKGSFVV